MLYYIKNKKNLLVVDFHTEILPVKQKSKCKGYKLEVVASNFPYRL